MEGKHRLLSVDLLSNGCIQKQPTNKNAKIYSISNMYIVYQSNTYIYITIYIYKPVWNQQQSHPYVSQQQPLQPKNIFFG